MSLKFDRIISRLKQTSSLFRNVSEESLRDSLQVFRLIELRETETMTLTGSETSDYLILVLGKIRVRWPDGEERTLTPADTSRSPMAMPRLPDRLELAALDDSWLVHVDAAMFDVLLILDSGRDLAAREMGLPPRYLDQARKSRVFGQIPLEKAEHALKSMRVEDVEKGREILKIGDKGGAFYVIVSGTADLREISPDTGLPEKTGPLGPGDRFGEDALLTGKESASAVTMTSDGVLLVLDKEDFTRLVARPLVPEVEPVVARAMIQSGYKPLDVRLVEEWEMEHLPQAVLVELHELRRQMGRLSKENRYVVYCRSGRRSSVATFQLTQSGFDACSMAGGIQAWPFEKESE